MADELTIIRDLYASGLSLRDIGATFGRSHQYAYRRLKKAGVKMRPPSGSGPEHSQWIGGRLNAGQGYVRQWIDEEDPMASMRDHQGYVREHRLVKARAIGRPLLDSETVHHVNGVRNDNRDENLELRSGPHGKGQRLCCLDCGSQRVGSLSLTQGES